MISLNCHLIRILNLMIILIQINVRNKQVLCEPQRRGFPNRRPLDYQYQDDYQDYTGPESNDYYEEEVHPGLINYMTELTKSEVESNNVLLSELTKPPAISSRGGVMCDRTCTRCLASCNHLKKARGATASPLVQYLYLTVCAKGCKKMIKCVNDKYCLPVMQENPDYFIQCVNSCPLFPIIPKIFLKA